MVALRCDGDPELRCTAPRKGDRIAQAKLVRAEQWELVEVDELTDTERGTGGLGSTGR